MKNWQILLGFGIVIILILIFRKTLNKPFMFDSFMNVIFRHEGGYVNDPDDLGGETNYGISKYNFPNVDIKNLTREKAKEIYKTNYYIPMEIEKIANQYNANLALHFFDMGVNAGIQNAKKLLLQAIEIKNKSGGNLTDIYKNLRIEYYKKIAGYRNNKKFLAGWLNRVNSTNVT